MLRWGVVVVQMALAGLVVFALIQAAMPTPGPKLVPTCEDNGALRVQIQRTGELWVLCYWAHAETQQDQIQAVPESEIGALP